MIYHLYISCASYCQCMFEDPEVDQVDPDPFREPSVLKMFVLNRRLISFKQGRAIDDLYGQAEFSVILS